MPEMENVARIVTYPNRSDMATQRRARRALPLVPLLALSLCNRAVVAFVSTVPSRYPVRPVVTEKKPFGRPSCARWLHQTQLESLPVSSTSQINSTSEASIEVFEIPPPESASPLSSAKSWLRTNVLLGMEPTPELLAIVTIYFVEGALGLARLAQTYLLKDELSLGPAELSALSGIFTLPWTIKPLYGFLSDGFPLFGYQRKSYLILSGILGGLSYAVLGMNGFWEGLETGTALTGTVGALMLSSACVAMSDVVADGIVVKRSREASDQTTAGGLQSLCWGASAFGGLLSAYFSGSLLQVLSVREVFGLAAALPFLVALIAFGMEEKPLKQTNLDSNLLGGVREQVDSLLTVFKQPAIWRPALFLFLWQATPTSDGAFFFFLSNDLHLGPEFMGRVRLVTAAAGLVGVWLYQQYFRTAKIKDILFWSSIASFPLGMLPVLLITHLNRAIGIPDTALIFGDDVALSALGQISFLPTLVLAAKLCPPGIEAVLFATLMSIFNGASTVGTELGAALTKAFGVTESNFDNLYVPSPYIVQFESSHYNIPILQGLVNRRLQRELVASAVSHKFAG